MPARHSIKCPSLVFMNSCMEAPTTYLEEPGRKSHVPTADVLFLQIPIAGGLPLLPITADHSTARTVLHDLLWSPVRSIEIA
jgi:hypothetical protein